MQILSQRYSGRIIRLNMFVTAVCLISFPLATLSAFQDDKKAESNPNALSVILNSNLGIYVTPGNQNFSKDLNIEARQIVVLGVFKNSEADKAGLLPGDIIESSEVWADPDKTGNMRIRRDGTTRNVTVRTRKHDLKNFTLVENKSRRSQPKQIRVDQNGDGDFRTITAAVLSASPGDYLILEEGLYEESLLLSRGLTIQAKERGTAILVSSLPLRAIGAHGLTLMGLVIDSSNGNALSVWETNDFTVEQSDIVFAKNNGIFLSHCRRATIEKCNIQGQEKTNGVQGLGSELTARENVISNCQRGIALYQDSIATLEHNLMEANDFGVVSFGSRLTANENLITGKDESSGFYLQGGEIDLSGNSIRRQYAGMTLSKVKGQLLTNLLSQNKVGLILEPSSLTAIGNRIQNNRYLGIRLTRGKETQDEPVDISIVGNTISRNGASGIYLQDCPARIVANLIEGNGWGIFAGSGKVEIRNNTVVLQSVVGIKLDETSDVELFNNIIAFNKWGIETDASARTNCGYNNVFGNIARKEFPLLDGNYSRVDRVTLSNKDRVHVRIFPANDLKADTDFSVDPKFVKMGDDYRLRLYSRLASKTGQNSDVIGAFPVEGTEGGFSPTSR